MKQITTHTTYKSVHQIFNINRSLVDDDELDLSLLYAIVDFFRPKRPKEVNQVSIRVLLDYLIEFESDRFLLKKYIKDILHKRKFNRMMSDVDILQEAEFFNEVKKRTWNKILPYQPQKDTLEYVLNQVFFLRSDYIWIYKIPYNEIHELFEILNFQTIFDQEKYTSGMVSEVLFTIGLLSQRMSGRAMETMIIRMVPEYTHLENPFLGMEREFLEIETLMRSGEISYLTYDDINLKQFQILLKQCFDFIAHAYKNSAKYGITLRVNQNLMRLQQQLQRIELMISFLIVNSEGDKIRNTVKLGQKLIEYNCLKNEISSLLRQSIQVVSYEITQYTAKTGEHYITQTAKEYIQMFKAALGGGLVVGFLCVFKVLLSKTESSDFGYAILYSLNYAFGFILIYLLGYTLATKQPAMTATTIAKAIEDGDKNAKKNNQKYIVFAQLFARLSRSQFIAFAGNVIMAFPIALLVMWLFQLATGVEIGDYKSTRLLTDVNPLKSPAIFHAAIAGVYLFLSGVIAGNVSNSMKHNQVSYRIEEHPLLKRLFGIEKTQKIAQWVSKKWPGIMSNLFFGIFMGTTHSIGNFIGIDLDIRHITFASGNVALGLFGKNFDIALSTAFWLVVGVILIGFVNFIVSFMLSLYLASKSRGLGTKELIPMFYSVSHYFVKYPLKFFIPVKDSKKPKKS